MASNRKHQEADTPRSEQRFSRALRDLLVERELCLTPNGNVNFVEFSKLLPTIHYETLRKALREERQVTPHVLEEVATTLGIDPVYFAEYRMWLAQQAFDVKAVGWETAMANLREFAEKHTRR